MIDLLGRISVFMVAAFALGVVVGWLFWRSGRVSVPSARWRALHRDQEVTAGLLAGAQAERDELRVSLLGAAAQLERLHVRAAVADRDRDAARLERSLVVAELAEAGEHLEQVRAQAHHLQRRVTELSLLSSRRHAVDPPPPLVPGRAAPPWPRPPVPAATLPPAATAPAAAAAGNGAAGNGAAGNGAATRPRLPPMPRP